MTVKPKSKRDRVEQAKVLLRETDMSYKEIANITGLGNSTVSNYGLEIRGRQRQMKATNESPEKQQVEMTITTDEMQPSTNSIETSDHLPVELRIEKKCAKTKDVRDAVLNTITLLEKLEVKEVAVKFVISNAQN